MHIGKSVVIKGELNGSEDLTIEGHVEGKIELRDHVLTIGPNGKIRAAVFAKAVDRRRRGRRQRHRYREGRHSRQRLGRRRHHLAARRHCRGRALPRQRGHEARRRAAGARRQGRHEAGRARRSLAAESRRLAAERTGAGPSRIRAPRRRASSDARRPGGGESTGKPWAGLLGRIGARRGDAERDRCRWRNPRRPGACLCHEGAEEIPGDADQPPRSGAARPWPGHRSNVSFFGEQLGCKIFVEDFYADIDRHERAGHDR